MNLFESLLLLVAVCAALPLAGSWLGARLTGASPAERLAVSVIAGLCLLIWNVSLLGFFRPIAGALAWLCLWPLLLGLVDRRARSGFASDLVAVALNRRGALALAGGVLFLALLLGPLLVHPDLVFYDGTSNHDAFFWISNAEQLKRHTYMVESAKSATQPFTNNAGVLAGWTPLWGRIAAEGLLALLSAIVGASPLKLYLSATAALFLPWIAATYLVARTFFVRGRLTWPALLGLALAQPIFVFFHANANLPNLLGVLAGALLIVALSRGRPGSDRLAWFALVALALHALLCSYPELAPFVLLPAGLLWVRHASVTNPAHPTTLAQRVGPVSLALLAGLALNPATTIRACFGFIASFEAARHDANWANIFQALGPFDLPAAISTLSIYVRADFTLVGSVLLSLAVIAATILVFRRSPDRFGAAAALSGSGLLLGYTIVAHFNYGLQKSAQFGGIAIAALLSVAALNFLSPPFGSRAWPARVTALAVGFLLLYATVRNDLGIWKWSHRKALTTEWFKLRDYARAHFTGEPVLIDAPTFRMPFFHGMWAVYFLADSQPIFSDRGQENGGYLRDYTRTEKSAGRPAVAAVLVSAAWADTFDADSPRLLIGPSLALLRTANRVTALRGFAPENGVPESASTAVAIEVTPHGDNRLRLELAPRVEEEDLPPFPSPDHWTVVVEVAGAPPQTTDLTGSPPWRFDVPLAAGRLHRIEISAAGPAAPVGRFPFAVRRLRIDAQP